MAWTLGKSLVPGDVDDLLLGKAWNDGTIGDNVVKTTINHPEFYGLYHRCMVICGMVYDIVLTSVRILVDNDGSIRSILHTTALE